MTICEIVCISIRYSIFGIVNAIALLEYFGITSFSEDPKIQFVTQSPGGNPIKLTLKESKLN